MLFPSVQVCNRLFNYLINQAASAWDKDVTERTDTTNSKLIISLHVVWPDVTCSCCWLHTLVWHPGSLCCISWYLKPCSFSIFFLTFQSSLAYLLLCPFVSICLHSAILTLRFLTFAFCLPAHLSSMLSSYLSACLSDSQFTLSICSIQSHTFTFTHSLLKPTFSLLGLNQHTGLLL